MQEDVYLVDSIIEERQNARTGVHEYFVKWEGYSSAENTWEPADNILNQELIDEFEERKRQQRAKEKQEAELAKVNG